MTRINSETFAAEIRAAGLAAVPYGYTQGEAGDATLEFGPEATDEQRAALQALWDAHDPDAPAPPVEPDPVTAISRQQCAMQMAVMGLVTPPEMVAMAKDGTPPAIVEDLLGQMPEPDQSFARAAFAKATYSRTDPLLVTLMLGQSIPVEGGDTRPATEADIDAFFAAAATL